METVEMLKEIDLLRRQNFKINYQVLSQHQKLIRAC